MPEISTEHRSISDISVLFMFHRLLYIAEPSVRDMEWRTGLASGGGGAATLHGAAVAVAAVMAALASAAAAI